MDQSLVWWYLVIFGLPVLFLALTIGIAYRGYKTSGKRATLYTFGFVLLFTVLFVFIPWNVMFGDGKKGIVVGKHLSKGNWVNVYEHPTDPDLVVKQFHSVTERRSLWHKVTRKNLFTNPEARTGLDYYAWCASMIIQWDSVRTMEKYQGIIHGIPVTKELDGRTLSWAQEKALKPGPNHPVTEDMRKTNEDLRKHDLHYVDAHCDNLMVSPSTGHVIYTDGELCQGMVLGIVKWLFWAMGNEFVPVDEMDRMLWSDAEPGKGVVRRQPPITSKNHLGELREGAYQ